MLNIKVRTIEEEIEVSEDGTFELPSKRYTTSELKKIAHDINRAMRESKLVED